MNRDAPSPLPSPPRCFIFVAEGMTGSLYREPSGNTRNSGRRKTLEPRSTRSTRRKIVRKPQLPVPCIPSIPWFILSVMSLCTSCAFSRPFSLKPGTHHRDKEGTAFGESREREVWPQRSAEGTKPGRNRACLRLGEDQSVPKFFSLRFLAAIQPEAGNSPQSSQ